jgi:hypothetical protein
MADSDVLLRGCYPDTSNRIPIARFFLATGPIARSDRIPTTARQQTVEPDVPSPVV